MTLRCDTPLSEDVLTEYWVGELAPEREAAVEEHVFACAACAGRLESLAALGAGVASLARQGRIAGVISRALLHALQQAGVRVRLFTVQPGQTIPCWIEPDDDLVVLSMGAVLEGVDQVDLDVTGPGGAPMGAAVEAPVLPGSADVLWATPGRVVQAMPSTRLKLTLRASGQSTPLGEYVLEHRAADAR